MSLLTDVENWVKQVLAEDYAIYLGHWQSFIKTRDSRYISLVVNGGRPLRGGDIRTPSVLVTMVGAVDRRDPTARAETLKIEQDAAKMILATQNTDNCFVSINLLSDINGVIQTEGGRPALNFTLEFIY